MPAFLSGWDGADGWGDDLSFDEGDEEEEEGDDPWGAWAVPRLDAADTPPDTREMLTETKTGTKTGTTTEPDESRTRLGRGDAAPPSPEEVPREMHEEEKQPGIAPPDDTALVEHDKTQPNEAGSLGRGEALFAVTTAEESIEAARAADLRQAADCVVSNEVAVATADLANDRDGVGAAEEGDAGKPDRDGWGQVDAAPGPALAEEAEPARSAPDPFAFEEGAADIDAWGAWNDDAEPQQEEPAPAEPALEWGALPLQTQEGAAGVSAAGAREDALPIDKGASPATKPGIDAACAPEERLFDSALPAQMTPEAETPRPAPDVGAERTHTSALVDSEASRQVAEKSEKPTEDASTLEWNQVEEAVDGGDARDDSETPIVMEAETAETATVTEPQAGSALIHEDLPASPSGVDAEVIHASALGDMEVSPHVVEKSEKPAEEASTFDWNQVEDAVDGGDARDDSEAPIVIEAETAETATVTEPQAGSAPIHEDLPASPSGVDAEVIHASTLGDTEVSPHVVEKSEKPAEEASTFDWNQVEDTADGLDARDDSEAPIVIEAETAETATVTEPQAGSALIHEDLPASPSGVDAEVIHASALGDTEVSPHIVEKSEKPAEEASTFDWNQVEDTADSLDARVDSEAAVVMEAETAETVPVTKPQVDSAPIDEDLPASWFGSVDRSAEALEAKESGNDVGAASEQIATDKKPTADGAFSWHEDTFAPTLTTEATESIADAWGAWDISPTSNCEEEESKVRETANDMSAPTVPTDPVEASPKTGGDKPVDDDRSVYNSEAKTFNVAEAIVDSQGAVQNSFPAIFAATTDLGKSQDRATAEEVAWGGWDEDTTDAAEEPAFETSLFGVEARVKTETVETSESDKRLAGFGATENAVGPENQKEGIVAAEKERVAGLRNDGARGPGDARPDMQQVELAGVEGRSGNGLASQTPQLGVFAGREKAAPEPETFLSFDESAFATESEKVNPADAWGAWDEMNASMQTHNETAKLADDDKSLLGTVDGEIGHPKGPAFVSNAKQAGGSARVSILPDNTAAQASPVVDAWPLESKPGEPKAPTSSSAPSQIEQVFGMSPAEPASIPFASERNDKADFSTSPRPFQAGTQDTGRDTQLFDADSEMEFAPPRRDAFSIQDNGKIALGKEGDESQDIRSTDVDVSSTVAGTEVPSVAAPSSVDDFEWEGAAKIPTWDLPVQTVAAEDGHHSSSETGTEAATKFDEQVRLRTSPLPPPPYPALDMSDVDARVGQRSEPGGVSHEKHGGYDNFTLERNERISSVKDSFFDIGPNTTEIAADYCRLEAQHCENVDTMVHPDHAFDDVRNEFPSSRAVDQIVPSTPPFPEAPAERNGDRSGGAECISGPATATGSSQPPNDCIGIDPIQYSLAGQTPKQHPTEQRPVSLHTWGADAHNEIQTSKIGEAEHRPTTAPVSMKAAPFPTGKASNYWTKKLESSSQDAKRAWADVETTPEEPRGTTHGFNSQLDVPHPVACLHEMPESGMSRSATEGARVRETDAAAQEPVAKEPQYNSYAPKTRPHNSDMSQETNGPVRDQASVVIEDSRWNGDVNAIGWTEPQQDLTRLPMGMGVADGSGRMAENPHRTDLLQQIGEAPKAQNIESAWGDQPASGDANLTGWNSQTAESEKLGEPWPELLGESVREDLHAGRSEGQRTDRDELAPILPHTSQPTTDNAVFNPTEKPAISGVEAPVGPAAYDPFVPTTSASAHEYSQFGWDWGTAQDNYASTAAFDLEEKASPEEPDLKIPREGYGTGHSTLETRHPGNTQQTNIPESIAHDRHHEGLAASLHTNIPAVMPTAGNAESATANAHASNHANVPTPQEAVAGHTSPRSTNITSHPSELVHTYDSNFDAYAPRPSSSLPPVPALADTKYAPKIYPSELPTEVMESSPVDQVGPDIWSNNMVQDPQNYTPILSAQGTSAEIPAFPSEQDKNRYAVLGGDAAPLNQLPMNGTNDGNASLTTQDLFQGPAPPHEFPTAVNTSNTAHTRTHSYPPPPLVPQGPSHYQHNDQKSESSHGPPVPDWAHYPTSNTYGGATDGSTVTTPAMYPPTTETSTQLPGHGGDEDSSKLQPVENLQSVERKREDPLSLQPAAMALTGKEYGMPIASAGLSDRDVYAPAGSQVGSETIIDPNMYTYPFSIMDATAPADLDYRPPRPVLSWGFGGSMMTIHPPAGQGQQDGYEARTESTTACSIVRLYELGTISGDGSNDDWIAASEAIPPLAFPPKPSDLLPYADMCDRLSNCAAGMKGSHAESRAALWRLLSVMCRHNTSDWRDKAGSAISGPSAVPMMGRNDSSSFLCGRFAGESPLKPSSISSRKSELELSESAAEVERLVTQGQGLEAIRVAQAAGLWSLALVLASTFDQTLYKSLITDFAKKSLNDGSALQTLFFSMAENDAEILQKATSTSGLTEWRKTVTMLLTNYRSAMKADPQRGERFLRLIDQVGEALISQLGDIVGGHVCYLLSGRISILDSSSTVLLGADSKRPVGCPRSLGSAAAILQSLVYEAIVCAQSGKSFPHLLPFRLVLAEEIAAVGRSDIALSHCESVVAGVKTTFDSGRNDIFTLPFLAGLESLDQRLRAHLGLSHGTERVGKLTAMGRSLSAAVFNRTSATPKPTPSQTPVASTSGGSTNNPSPDVPPHQFSHADMYSSRSPPTYSNQAPSPHHVNGSAMIATSHHPPYGGKGVSQGPPPEQQISGNLQVPALSVPHFSGQDSSRSGPGQEESGSKRWNEFVSKTIGVLAPAHGDLSPLPRTGQPIPSELHGVPPMGLGLDTGSRAPGHELDASHMRSQSMGNVPAAMLQMSQAALVTNGRQQTGAHTQGMPAGDFLLSSTPPQPFSNNFNGTVVQEQKTAAGAETLSHRRSASDMTAASQTSEKKPPRPPRRSTGASASTSALDSVGETKPPVAKGLRYRLTERILSAFRGPPRAHMGNDNKFVFDKERGRWVIEGEDPDEGDDTPPPPPTDEDAVKETQTTEALPAPSYENLHQYGQPSWPMPRAHSMREADSSQLLYGQARASMELSAPMNPAYNAGQSATSGPGLKSSIRQDTAPSQRFPPPRAVSSENMAFAENGSEASGISSASLPMPFSANREETSAAASSGNPNRFRASTRRRAGRRAYVDTFNKGASSAHSMRAPLPGRLRAPVIGSVGAAGPRGGMKIFTPSGPAATPTAETTHQSPAGMGTPLTSTSRQASVESGLSQQFGAPSLSNETPYQPPQYVPRSPGGPRMMA